MINATKKQTKQEKTQFLYLFNCGLHSVVFFSFSWISLLCFAIFPIKLQSPKRIMKQKSAQLIQITVYMRLQILLIELHSNEIKKEQKAKWMHAFEQIRFDGVSFYEHYKIRHLPIRNLCLCTRFERYNLCNCELFIRYFLFF